MANQLEEVAIFKVNTKEAVESIKDLRNNVKTYKDELTTLTRGTDAYNAKVAQLAESQGALNRINRDARNATANLTDVYAGLTRSVAGIASGFQVATSAANLFGVESESLVASIQKLQAIQGLVQGLYGLSNGIKNAANIVPRLTTAFRALNAAIAANPFAAAAILIGTVVAGLNALSRESRNTSISTKDLDDAFKNFNNTIGRNNDLLDDNIYQLRLAGASQEEIYQARLKGIRENIEESKKYVGSLKDELRSLEDYATAIKKLGLNAWSERIKYVREELEKGNGILDGFYEDQKKIVQHETNNRREAEIRAADQRRADAKRAAEQAYRDRQAEIARLEQLERDRISQREAEERSFRERLREMQKEINYDALTAFDHEDIEIPIFDKILDFTNKEAVQERLKNLNDEAEELRKIFTEDGLGTKSGVDAWNQYLKVVAKAGDIEDQYVKATQKREDAIRKARKDTLDATVQVLNATASILGDNTVAAKALGIASATISTYVAIDQVLANPLELRPAAKILQAIAVGATGLANVKNIISTKVPGTSDSTSSANVAMPALPTMPEVDTSAFEVYSTINPADVDRLNQSSTVLVVEDVNRVQNRVQVAEDSASF